MGKVTSKACSLDFIRDLEGESLAAFAPRSRVAGIVPIEQECGSERLQERCQVYRSGRFAHAALIAGDGDNHATPLYIFVRMKIQTGKNTKIRKGMQGQGYENHDDLS